MPRISNFIIVLTNAVFTVVGLAAIAFAVYIFVHGPTQCQRLIQNPILITGTILFAISTLGLIGTCYRNNFIMIIYLIIVFLSIVFLIGFSVFVFLITNEPAGKAVSGKGFKDANTGNLENWLENHFAKGKRWGRVRDCLAESRVCKSLGDKDVGFYKKNLSPVQSGCCKPPSECGFEPKNATWWTAPKRDGAAATNKDCTTWSNVQNQLCFGCESCKAGAVANVRKQWRTALIFNACLALLVVIIYSLGCCARRNNRTPWKRHFF